MLGKSDMLEAPGESWRRFESPLREKRRGGIEERKARTNLGQQLGKDREGSGKRVRKRGYSTRNGPAKLRNRRYLRNMKSGIIIIGIN